MILISAISTFISINALSCDDFSGEYKIYTPYSRYGNDFMRFQKSNDLQITQNDCESIDFISENKSDLFSIGKDITVKNLLRFGSMSPSENCEINQNTITCISTGVHDVVDNPKYERTITLIEPGIISHVGKVNGELFLHQIFFDTKAISRANTDLDIATLKDTNEDLHYYDRGNRSTFSFIHRKKSWFGEEGFLREILDGNELKIQERNWRYKITYWNNKIELIEKVSLKGISSSCWNKLELPLSFDLDVKKSSELLNIKSLGKRSVGKLARINEKQSKGLKVSAERVSLSFLNTFYSESDYGYSSCSPGTNVHPFFWPQVSFYFDGN